MLIDHFYYVAILQQCISQIESDVNPYSAEFLKIY